jgi:hypothetical protein
MAKTWFDQTAGWLQETETPEASEDVATKVTIKLDSPPRKAVTRKPTLWLQDTQVITGLEAQLKSVPEE